jgi:hypothetical protein
MKSRLGLCHLGLLLLTSLPLNFNLALPAISEQMDRACPIGSDRAGEPAKIASTKGRVVRQQEKLIIKTRRGAVTFKNVCGNDFTNYSLVDYLPDIQYFVVASDSYEYNDYTLISGKTGAKITIDGEPIFSPDRKRFAAMLIDELNGRTSIEIYRLTPTGIIKEYRNLTVKDPANPVWKNNSTIEFQRTVPNSSDPTPAKLTRKNGVWKIT